MRKNLFAGQKHALQVYVVDPVERYSGLGILRNPIIAET